MPRVVSARQVDVRQRRSEAIERLVHWMRSDHPTASVAACNALLDRGHGKVPAFLVKHETPIRDPLEMTDQEINDRLSVLRGILIEHGIDVLEPRKLRSNGSGSWFSRAGFPCASIAQRFNLRTASMQGAGSGLPPITSRVTPPRSAGKKCRRANAGRGRLVDVAD